MQFHLPHGFRGQCRRLLQDRLPDVYAAILAAGATEVVPDGAPPTAAMLAVRRSVFERACWQATSREPGVERAHRPRRPHRGRGRPSRRRRGRLHVRGRGPRRRRQWSCRTAQRSVPSAGPPGGLRDGVRGPPVPPAGRRHSGAGQRRAGLHGSHRGFLVMVFRHDAGTFTVLFIRPSEDKALALLRHADAFTAACRVVPGLAEWTGPDRSEPIDAVRAGAGLTNEYTAQPTEVARLVAIGDAFGMTNPQGARGVALGMESAAVLADLVRHQGRGRARGRSRRLGERPGPALVPRPCRVGCGVAGSMVRPAAGGGRPDRAGGAGRGGADAAPGVDGNARAVLQHGADAGCARAAARRRYARWSDRAGNRRNRTAPPGTSSPTW